MKGRLLLAGLPTRFCFPSALLYAVSFPLTLSLYNLTSLYFSFAYPARRLLDIWTHTKNASSVAREKGLGNRLRDSLPSLNERETLHTAQRAGSPALCPTSSALGPSPGARLVRTLLAPSGACYSARLFPSSGGRARPRLTNEGAFLRNVERRSLNRLSNGPK